MSNHRNFAHAILVHRQTRKLPSRSWQKLGAAEAVLDRTIFPGFALIPRLSTWKVTAPSVQSAGRTVAGVLFELSVPDLVQAGSQLLIHAPEGACALRVWQEVEEASAASWRTWDGVCSGHVDIGSLSICSHGFAYRGAVSLSVIPSCAKRQLRLVLGQADSIPSERLWQFQLNVKNPTSNPSIQGQFWQAEVYDPLAGEPILTLSSNMYFTPILQTNPHMKSGYDIVPFWQGLQLMMAPSSKAQKRALSYANKTSWGQTAPVVAVHIRSSGALENLAHEHESRPNTWAFGSIANSGWLAVLALQQEILNDAFPTADHFKQLIAEPWPSEDNDDWPTEETPPQDLLASLTKCIEQAVQLEFGDVKGWDVYLAATTEKARKVAADHLKQSATNLRRIAMGSSGRVSQEAEE
eukprot:s2207_g11.t1